MLIQLSFAQQVVYQEQHDLQEIKQKLVNKINKHKKAAQVTGKNK